MSATKVVTGKVRLSYLNVFTPKAIGDSKTPKYSVSLLIPKKDTVTLKKIEEAIKAAKVAGVAKIGANPPKTLKTPLRDGDDERPDDPAYKDCFFLNANANNQPGLVDKDRNAIIDPKELYSGCWGRASITFYAYNTEGSKGIACGLNHIQKLQDDEHLDGRTNPEDEFSDDFEDDDMI